MIVNGNHQRRGYDLSEYGYNVAYHYFIGTTGKVVQTRPDTDRTMHTRNDDINMHSVAIVLAGSFDTDIPTKAQVESLISLVSRLQKKYHVANDHIIGHREASPTSCPGSNVMKILLHYREKHDS